MYDQSAISKYIYGDLDPPAEFIYFVARCLDLIGDQASALIDAHVADVDDRFTAEYEEILKREADK